MNCTKDSLMSAAIHLLESDAIFSLRIQTSEPVLVGIARSSEDGVVSRASIARHRERERSEGVSTEAYASELSPYMFGLHEEPPEPYSSRVKRSCCDGASSTSSTVCFPISDHSDSELSLPEAYATVCPPYRLEDEEGPPQPQPTSTSKKRRHGVSSPSTASSVDSELSPSPPDFRDRCAHGGMNELPTSGD